MKVKKYWNRKKVATITVVQTKVQTNEMKKTLYIYGMSHHTVTVFRKSQ